MKKKLMRPEGFSILRYMWYLDFAPYIAIGLFAAAIIFWVVFKILKTRWVKTIAVTLTVLTIIDGILSFVPYVFEDYMGEQFPSKRDGPFQDMTPEEREQFFQDRQKSKSSGTEINSYGRNIYYEKAA